LPGSGLHASEVVYTSLFKLLAKLSMRVRREVGISEIKLLTRAAFLTVTVISLLGLMFALATGVTAVRESIAESGPFRRMLIKLRRTEESLTRRKDSIIINIRTASQQAQSVREASTLSFGLAYALIYLSLKPLGIQLSIVAKIILFFAGTILTATLYSGWRDKKTRYLTFACGVAIGLSLLCIAAITGGLNTGTAATSSGNIPNFVDLLGVDISQVHPEWLNSKVIPPQYESDQDLLEVGSDTETAFLYDCKTDTTYRIPLSGVVLAYPVYSTESSSTILRHLHCSATHS
jgi:hypothetical protein